MIPRDLKVSLLPKSDNGVNPMNSLNVSLNGSLSQIPLLRFFDKDGSFFYSLRYLETNTNSNMLNYDTIKENITYGITKRFNF